MKVGYVEEDDDEREQDGGEADKDDDANFWIVGEGRDTQAGSTRGQEA